MLDHHNRVKLLILGIHKRQDGQLGMGSKVVRLDGNTKILTVDDTKYKLVSGLLELITNKHP